MSRSVPVALSIALLLTVSGPAGAGPGGKPDPFAGFDAKQVNAHRVKAEAAVRRLARKWLKARQDLVTVCPMCLGSGRDNVAAMLHGRYKTCSNCGGTGKILNPAVDRKVFDGYYYRHDAPVWRAERERLWKRLRKDVTADPMSLYSFSIRDVRVFGEVAAVMTEVKTWEDVKEVQPDVSWWVHHDDTWSILDRPPDLEGCPFALYPAKYRKKPTQDPKALALVEKGFGMLHDFRVPPGKRLQFEVRIRTPWSRKEPSYDFARTRNSPLSLIGANVPEGFAADCAKSPSSFGRELFRRMEQVLRLPWLLVPADFDLTLDPQDPRTVRFTGFSPGRFLEVWRVRYSGHGLPEHMVEETTSSGSREFEVEWRQRRDGYVPESLVESRGGKKHRTEWHYTEVEDIWVPSRVEIQDADGKWKLTFRHYELKPAN